MKLLVNAQMFFDELFYQIDNTEKSIEIKMFIWRDDIIGNRLLDKLDEKASQGVSITIHKDMYGSIFEKSEENQLSLFHKEKHNKLDFIANILTKGYHPYARKIVPQVPNEKLTKFLNKSNVILKNAIFKDHSKYFIFDDARLIISGINIEDKEIYGDIQGRIYQDYALLIKKKDEVDYFKNRYSATSALDFDRHIDYLIRNTDNKDQNYLIECIDKAHETIIMHMAYFGNKSVNQALFRALKRNVNIVIVTSEVSNIQINYNIQQINKFIKKGIKIYLYSGIIHAKAMLFDNKKFIVGSWNLNNAAMKKLNELSAIVDDHDIINVFISQHNHLIENSYKVLNKMTYRKLHAMIESIYS